MPKKEKGKAQESMKGEEGKPNEREREDRRRKETRQAIGEYSFSTPHGGQRAPASGSKDVDDPWALDLNSHLNSHSALDSHSHTIEQDISKSAEHGLTALRATLTI